VYHNHESFRSYYRDQFGRLCRAIPDDVVDRYERVLDRPIFEAGTEKYSAELRFGVFSGWPLPYGWESCLLIDRILTATSCSDTFDPDKWFVIEHQSGGHACHQLTCVATPLPLREDAVLFFNKIAADYYFSDLRCAEEDFVRYINERLPIPWQLSQSEYSRAGTCEGYYPLSSELSFFSSARIDRSSWELQIAPMLADPVLEVSLRTIVIATNSD
jgi:hypothetical protein